MARQEYTDEQLQHFMAHPEEVDSTNAALVTRLAEMELPADMRTELKGEDVAKVDEDDADVKAAEAEAAAKLKEEETGGKGAKEAEVEAKPKVLTKDGKHTLPFEVLEDARQGKTVAEQALADANRTIIQLTDRLQGRAPAGRAAVRPDEVQTVIADLKASLPKLQEEAPWMEGSVAKMVSALEILSARQTELATVHVQDEQAVRRELETDADAAMEANPTLVLWQAKSPELFDEAVKADAYIRRDPAMRERYTTFEDRFAAAVRIVQANHDGEEIPLPEAVAAPAAVRGTASPSASEVQTRAAKALAKASAEAVHTLSDIPGGAGEMTAQEALENLPIEALAAKFERMTPQQIIDYTMRTG